MASFMLFPGPSATATWQPERKLAIPWGKGEKKEHLLFKGGLLVSIIWTS
jgi:hypothetical protein